MRVSQLLLPTLRDPPADAELASHRLMLRSGLIRQIAAGIYTWLPLGVRVLRRVEAIVREEMVAAGGQEVLMPGMQPAELWQESGRWSEYGPELLRLRDRHEREFCLGPTHEEIITDLARREIRSYKQLPANFFQIQTKFRDEVRPRFGVMRAREFIMKDAYSFHIDEASLADTYQRMFDAYCRIFRRLGLDFRVVEADTGNIGGRTSHEFHVLAEAGEDQIAFGSEDDFAANLELAALRPPPDPPPLPSAPLATVDTPGVRTITEVSEYLEVPSSSCVKTLMVEAAGGGLVALVVRGDHELNPRKAEKLAQVAAPLRLASEDAIAAAIGCSPGSLGPIGLSVPVIVDYDALRLSAFVCGANARDRHHTGANWTRDCSGARAADLRWAREGDPSPSGRGTLRIVRGIEVGHIFQLGTKYSKSMKATCLNEHGQAIELAMGCYGIGVSRIVAAAIEQHHDEHGIAWPAAISPFDAILIPINVHKSVRLAEAADALQRRLLAGGIDTLLDDRRERAGVIFADADLIGVPHRLVLSDKGLDAGTVEYKHRLETEARHLPLDGIEAFIRERLATGRARE
jgi:prolyl-tRNA synthetase